MSEPPITPVTRMQALSARVRAARGDDTRRQVTTRAAGIAAKKWGVDAPFIDEGNVRDLETRLVTPPADGRVLRCVLAAVEVPLVEALTIIEFWPDALMFGPRSPAQAVAAAMKMAGYPAARLVSTQGRRVIIEI